MFLDHIIFSCEHKKIQIAYKNKHAMCVAYSFFVSLIFEIIYTDYNHFGRYITSVIQWKQDNTYPHISDSILFLHEPPQIERHYTRQVTVHFESIFFFHKQHAQCNVQYFWLSKIVNILVPKLHASLEFIFFKLHIYPHCTCYCFIALQYNNTSLILPPNANKKHVHTHEHSCLPQSPLDCVILLK